MKEKRKGLRPRGSIEDLQRRKARDKACNLSEKERIEYIEEMGISEKEEKGWLKRCGDKLKKT